MNITIDLRGDEEIKRVLKSYTGREMQNRIRRGNRAGAAVFRKRLKAEGTRGDLPRTFRKTRTRNHRDGSVSVSPKSPLSAIFEHGAGQHTIAPRRGPFLASGQGEEPFFARGPVEHPGMRARPVIAPAFRSGEDAATRAWFDVMFDERIPVPSGVE